MGSAWWPGLVFQFFGSGLHLFAPFQYPPIIAIANSPCKVVNNYNLGCFLDHSAPLALLLATAGRRSAYSNVLLTTPVATLRLTTYVYGGSRSGKTFLLCRAILIRALRAPGSRHAIFRFRQNSVWNAIGLDTLPKVAKLANCQLTSHKQDKYFTLPNGSEIWLAGLDDKERVEKILGSEFVTIYHNEASQIPYNSYVMTESRTLRRTILKYASACTSILTQAALVIGLTDYLFRVYRRLILARRLATLTTTGTTLSRRLKTRPIFLQIISRA